MYRALRIAVLAAFVWLAGQGAPRADVIATWDVAGSDGQTAAVGSTAANVSAFDVTPVNVTFWPGGFCCFAAAANWGTGAAADPTKYYEFSLTPDAGYAIDYDSFTLSLFRGIQGALHGAESWELRSSVDAFGSALAAFDLTGTNADEQTLFANQDISAIGTQSGTVTFRLYGFDYTSPSDYSGLGNHPGPTPLSGTGSDVILEGSVISVPEPSALALVSLGLLGIAWAGRLGSARAPLGR